MVAIEFLAKLTLQQRHSYIPIYESNVAPRPNIIPLKSVTDAFLGMPKKSVAHRDRLTWKLLRDVAQNPSTATFLRKFTELFSNGALSKNVWSYLASVLMYPFHKKIPEGRTPARPALRPVTGGYILTRFGCRVMVKMIMILLAEPLLLSRQFSLGINGRVQQVILACTVTLEINPTWLMLDLDLENAHILCNRGKLEEELEINVVDHYMMMSYKALCKKP